MSGFELNKIFASFIIALLIIIAIISIANYLVKPKIPEQQAYKIEIPENEDTSQTSASSEKTEINAEPVNPILANASLNDGQKIAKKCTSCHNFQKGEPNKIGPNLYGIIGSSIGKSVGYAYSEAMANFGGKWTYEEVGKFLYKPKAYMEGTKMNFAGLKNVEDRANLILWLRENSDNPTPLP